MYIVGLGNPGTKYIHNRHNAGIQFVDWLHDSYAQQHSWRKDTHGQCVFTDILEEKKRTVLVKPLSYMNISGQAVHSYLCSANSKPTYEQVVIAHDDLDLPVSAWKLDFGKGPKGHNGIVSLEEHFKTSLFWRLRIGVDNRNPDFRISGEAYVLDDFTQKEYEVVRAQYPSMRDAIYKQVTA